MKKGRYVWAVVYSLALAAFTVYACLDTFVIRRIYAVPEQPVTRFTLNSPADGSASSGDTEDGDTGGAQQTDGVTGAESAEDITITVTEYRYKDTAVYAADIVLSSPEYLKTAFARSSYGKNVSEKTSVIAERNGALLAINGDYYGARERGYVIRGGIIYRSTSGSASEDLAIYRDGTMKIVRESEISAEQLLEDGAYDVFSFGPALIENGVIAVSTRYEVSQAMASNPRTAIGQIGDLHYVFVVSDGRTSKSSGLTLYELAEFMESLGVRTAYNLDGGGSSTMVYNGEVINNPTSNGRKITERSVSDIVYIGY